jgi:hypothetical protein
VSEGEPTTAAIGSGEHRTLSIGSAGEPTTAAIGSESEPNRPTGRPTHTTAELLRGYRRAPRFYQDRARRTIAPRSSGRGAYATRWQPQDGWKARRPSRRPRPVPTGCHPWWVPRSNPKTAADERFEAYLSEHRIPFEYEPNWAEEFGIEVEDNPDYLVDPDGARVICEVKQFESTAITERLLRSPGRAIGISPKEEFRPIRSKVTQTARDQLSPFKGMGIPLVVVLANPLAADVRLDDFEVTHALLGNPKERISHRPGMPPDSPARTIAEDYGALISIQEDGTIINHHPFVSAVVVVHQWPQRRDVTDDSYRWMDVYDVSGNPTPPGFSGTPLPRHVFNGPRDCWYGFTDNGFGSLRP